ncbi:MAG: hypothetical protein RSE64_07900, partial [Oscillospiraceae bacterium]
FAAGRHAGLSARATSWRGLLRWVRMDEGRRTGDDGRGLAPKGRGDRSRARERGGCAAAARRWVKGEGMGARAGGYTPPNSKSLRSL